MAGARGNTARFGSPCVPSPPLRRTTLAPLLPAPAHAPPVSIAGPPRRCAPHRPIPPGTSPPCARLTVGAALRQIWAPRLCDCSAPNDTETWEPTAETVRHPLRARRPAETREWCAKPPILLRPRACAEGGSACAVGAGQFAARADVNTCLRQERSCPRHSGGSCSWRCPRRAPMRGSPCRRRAT